MNNDPLLNYSLTTDPLPLQINTADASITITASNPGFFSDQAASNYVALTKIVLDFGAALTADPGTIQATATYTPANGKPVSWGSSSQLGAQFTFLLPSGLQIFPADGLTFAFQKIAISKMVASVTLTLTETASSPGDPANPYFPPQPSQERTTTRNLGVFPPNFAIQSLSISPSPPVAPGMPIQLAWAATAMANTVYKLSYAIEGAVQLVTQHADGTPLNSTDTYPNSAHDPQVALLVNRNTTFTLAVTFSETETVTAEKQITVDVPDPTINTFTATPATGLLVGDAVQLAWQTLAADYVTIDPPLDGVNPTAPNSGGATIYPLHYQRYTLTASGRGLNVRQSLVLFPMAPGWTIQTTTAPWQAAFAPLLLATEQLLWLLPASPNFSPMGPPGTNPIFSSPDGANWILVTPNAPVPVRAQGAALTDAANKKIWIMGGHDQEAALNDVWSSTNGTQWTNISRSAQWSPRSSFGCVYFGGKYWVMGGIDTAGSLLNEVWSSVDGAEWSQQKEPDWTARCAFGLMVFNNNLWMVGGQTANGATNEVWFSSDGVNWVQQQSGGGHHGTAGPPARAGYQLFGGKDLLFAFAGAADNSGNNPPCFYSMDASGQWLAATIPPGLSTTAMFFGSSTYNDSLWLAGGAELNATGSGVWAFRPD